MASHSACGRDSLSAFGVSEHSTIIFGVTAGDLLKFAGALQLVDGVEARGIEQTVSRDLAAKIGGDQRFGDEVPM